MEAASLNVKIDQTNSNKIANNNKSGSSEVINVVVQDFSSASMQNNYSKLTIGHQNGSVANSASSSFCPSDNRNDFHELFSFEDFLKFKF